MAENTYDSIPYPTFPRLATHPDRMAAVALLFGMEPAPVDRCRVLEIGCGNAGNLLPMAYALPRSRFLGIDLAEDPIAHARADIRALGLENIEVAARDLRALGPEVGEFDYIIAHGVYSWVPEDVRGRLLALCRQRLAPSGVALVSYNLYPGRHIRQMLREMMFHHTRGDAPQQCVDHARRFLDWLAKSCQAPATFRTLIEEDAAALLAYTDGGLAHDDLSEVNYPLYFRDFVAHAAAHGLEYLGDTTVDRMFDPRGLLAWLPDNRLEREQYTDFLYLRSFRHTLLCREEVPLSRSPRAETMDRLCFSAPVQMVEGAAAVRIGARQPAVEAVAQAMGACYPLPVTFQELLPYAGSAAELREMLLALISVGFAQCHAYGFPCQDSVSERPRATALARYQAQRSLQLANVIHTLINMDEFGRRLVLLLDGTRDRAALARDLAAGPDAPTPEEIARLLPERLQQMAGLGLLEA
ncbi:MAG: methyltransferase regulatory domain-containing protein [Bryobacteraceae bacterium]